MIYFDQAASSFPKPSAVAEAMSDAVNLYGANPGRSSHQTARTASDIIEKTRKKLQRLFHHDSPDRIIFSLNATQALNQAIEGLELQKDDEVIATVFEHNAVRRPLERLRAEKGVKLRYINADTYQGDWVRCIRENLSTRTKLVVATHGSNVTGEIIPVKEIGQALIDHSALFCVDASQTAGAVELDTVNMNIDLLAFPGHKGLLGPQGTGVLLAAKHVLLRPVYVGGTGSSSEQLLQPEVWPAGWESGTLNTPGIAGLLKGLEEVEKYGIEHIYEHEKMLASRCITGLESIPGITVTGPKANEERLGVVSFSIAGLDSEEAALILDQHYNIAVRAGLHCSPMVHQSYGTHQTGLIRASFGLYNTESEIKLFIEALKEIAEELAE